MTAGVRVLVQDRRRLVREGLRAALATEPGFDPCHDSLSEVCADVGLVLVGPAEDVAAGWAETSVAVVRFTDCVSIGAILEACRLRSRSEQPTGPEVGHRMLTRREVDVLRAIADGLSAKQVALALDISQKSVDNHKQRIFAKLGVQSQAHAVAVSLDAGWLGPVDARRGRTA